MGRLPLSGSKMRKIKFGTTVQATTPEKIEELRLKNPESVRSTGEAIDYLCNLLTGLQPRVARALDEACLREARQITNEMKALPVDGSEEMSFSQLELYREQFQRLHDHFSLYCEKEERPQGMRRVDLLGGDYAVLPPLGLYWKQRNARSLAARSELSKFAAAQNTMRLILPSSITESTVKRTNCSAQPNSGPA